MDDAWDRISNTPHAVGHNYQVMDLVDGTVVDIEMAPFSRVLYRIQAFIHSWVVL